jgi:hypothetical protein
MSNKRIRYLFQAKELMKLSIRYYEFVINEKYIEIIDNVAYKKADAENLLKVEYTYYTKNSKQNEILLSVHNIAKELEKLQKMGINKDRIMDNKLYYLSENKVKINSKYFYNWIVK